MNEISRIIEPKEKIIWQAQPKLSAYMTSCIIGSTILGSVVGVISGIFLKLLAGIIFGILLFSFGIVFSYFTYQVTAYAMTNKRVIIQTGIIGRDFKSIDYDRIQNNSVNVGILGVIFKVGTIQIFTGEMQSVGGGRNQPPRIQPKYDTFNYIESPYEALKILQTQLSSRKEKLYSGKGGR